ncbi:hypothetical protein E1B28_000383 [Marasmius oreades]|uniref:Uncharacterized protein n=1 Tax=Marasmius oreades TaxID=181124 RepID=A0A9P7V1B1_9AGAR|nr:uncharacterized protein E1B28_000383 [Marasmius oreades]KAG7098431.1 hypothetical protein E1B28_000383 [Marasmius oreades]
MTSVRCCSNLLFYLWAEGSYSPPEPSPSGSNVLADISNSTLVIIVHIAYLVLGYLLTGLNFVSVIYLVEGENLLQKMGVFGAMIDALRNFMVRKLCKKTDKEEEKTVMV